MASNCSGDDPPDRSERLKEELLDSTASAIRTGQRVADFMEEAGVRTDLLEGTGELLYEVFLQQLQVTNRALQSTFRLADSIVRRVGPPHPHHGGYEVVEKGKKGHFRAHIRNDHDSSGSIGVEVVLRDSDGTVIDYPRRDPPRPGWMAYFAKCVLESGQATLLRVELDTAGLSVGAYVALIRITLDFESGQKRVRNEELELHVQSDDR